MNFIDAFETILEGIKDAQNRIESLEKSSITRLSAHNSLVGRIDALEQSTILNPAMSGSGTSVYQILTRLQALEDRFSSAQHHNALHRCKDEHKHDWTKSEECDDLITCLRCGAQQTFLSPACRDMWIAGWLEGLRGV